MNHNNTAESVQGSHAVRPGFIDNVTEVVKRLTTGAPNVPPPDLECVEEFPSSRTTTVPSLSYNRATSSLRLLYPPSPEDIASVLFKCEQLSRETEHYLSDRNDREACLEMIASVARRGMLLMEARIPCEAVNLRGSTADSETDDSGAEEHPALAPKNDSEVRSQEHDAKTLDSLRDQLNDIRRFLISTAQLKAISPYMIGILLGTIVLIAGFLLYVNSVARFDSSHMPIPNISLTFAVAYYCGVAGAILSVLQRFTTGTLNLDHRLQKGHFVLLGATRPIIGATLGGVTYIFIMSALVPITVPDEGMTQVNFLGGLAVLAGFSERFAQGVLATAESKAQAGISSAATQEGTIRLEPQRR